MPTKPLETVLYRELSIIQAKEIINIASPLLSEIVNYGSNVIIRCATAVKGKENENLAPIALYRHILELVDGVDVLISKACPAPAIPLLRSSFEALLSLEYITEKSDTYVQRSLSWIFNYAKHRKEIYETLLLTTDLGKEFHKSIEEDKMMRDFPLPPSDKVQEAIDNLENFTEREQFNEVRIEFNRLKKKFGRRLHWYALFDGPTSLYKLAKHLKRNAQYDVLYKEWSFSTHAMDFQFFIGHTPDGEPGIRGLRDVSTISEVTFFACTLLIDSTRLLLNQFRPGETWGNWYKSEVRDRYRFITQHMSRK